MKRNTHSKKGKIQKSISEKATKKNQNGVILWMGNW